MQSGSSFRLTAALALLLPISAQAQVWRSDGRADFFLSVGTAATSYLLDGMPTPTVAVDLRRVLTAYSTNKLIRLRRASDDAEADIEFTATGALDTAAAATHCDATTCFVRTWYDQSGASRDLVQATAANQPAFIFDCLNAYPCVRFTASTHTLTAAANVTPATGTASFVVVANSSVGTTASTWIRENGLGGNRVNSNTGAATWSVFGGTSGSVAVVAPAAAWHAFQGVLNSGVSDGSVSNVDGVENTGTATGSTTAGAPGMIGVAANTRQAVAAAVFDNVILSAEQRAMINNSQHAWWGF